MSEDFNKINQGIKNGLASVYFAKVRCPVCKERIFANALACPNCKTDFTKPPYDKRISWQTEAMKIILIISLIVGVSICLTDAPVFLGIFIGLALYGFGYIVVQKIQSFKNYHHR